MTPSAVRVLRGRVALVLEHFWKRRADGLTDFAFERRIAHLPDDDANEDMHLLMRPAESDFSSRERARRRRAQELGSG